MTAYSIFEEIPMAQTSLTTRTFMITWNSSADEWPDYTDDARRAKIGNPREFHQWKIGHRKHIHSGDHLLIVKQGKEPRGLIGLATATSDWYTLEPGSNKQPSRT